MKQVHKLYECRYYTMIPHQVIFIHIKGYDTAIGCNQLRRDGIIVANDIKVLNGYNKSSSRSFGINNANERLNRVTKVQLNIGHIDLR